MQYLPPRAVYGSSNNLKEPCLCWSNIIINVAPGPPAGHSTVDESVSFRVLGSVIMLIYKVLLHCGV